MNDAYLNLLDVAAERYRTGGWTLADVYDFSSKLQDRYEREYGKPVQS